MGDALTDVEKAFVAKLKEEEQGHMLPADAPAVDVKRLIKQLQFVDQNCPGGLWDYARRARKLLADCRDGANPFEGYAPSLPEGETLTVGTPEYAEIEQLGLRQIPLTCFVLVAGGLGERLGWNDIKVALKSESTSSTCFMDLYARFILALQEYAGKRVQRKVILPLAIMTSGDTHEKTVALLKAHKYFGLMEDQVTLMMQQKVPALSGNDAKFAMNATDPFVMETKPHGHGDVHQLLMQKGLLKRWVEQGFKWLTFFQDTNGLVFRSLPAVLGVSAKHNFSMNSVGIPRTPGEAVGAICKLDKAKDGSSMTINVEYNLLEPLLKATTGKGDVADEATGLSPYCGNTNNFVCKIDRLSEVLERANGVIPEFANPKYADESKTKFKSPARLESLMQDIPKLLDPSDNVGFTQLERWISFSTVKNNIVDAAAKSKKGLPSESAFSGESDMYIACANMLRIAAEAVGASPIDIPQPTAKTYAGIEYQMGPRVVLMPSFACCLEELKTRLAGCKGKPFTLTADSTVVLEGDVVISGLQVDGTLLARASEGTVLRLENLSVKNKGWEVVPVNADDADATDDMKLRGFKIVKHEETVLKGNRVAEAPR